MLVSITTFQDKKLFICQLFYEIKNFNELVNHNVQIMQKHSIRTDPSFLQGPLNPVDSNTNFANNNLTTTNQKPNTNKNLTNLSNSEASIKNVLNKNLGEDEKVYLF